MKKLSALLTLALGMAMGMPVAQAETAAPAKKTSKQAPKKTAQKKNRVQPTPVAQVGGDEDDQVPDLAMLTATDYQCELGNSLTIHHNQVDDSYIALRWKKELHRMKRVPTTTGANRFENKKHGLVWIDIPAKGMLLDSKKGQQLANECRNPERLRMLANAGK